MKRAGTTLRLTVAALGTIALFGAAAAAGIDRSTEMMNVGISPEFVQTSAGLSGAPNTDDPTAHID